MMKEGALRKKLQDLGIPNWGSKDLLKRRHVEWLNIYNSNCDAHESLRKSKRDLLRELTEWENTQGGRADLSENKFMKKTFDANGHAKSHKSDFDDLIARARQQRAKSTAEEGQGDTTHAEGGVEPNGSAPRNEEAQPQVDKPEQPNQADQETQPGLDAPPATNKTDQNHDGPRSPSTTQPYANNDSALATIQRKVQQANEAQSSLPILRSQSSVSENLDLDKGVGIQNPLGGADRKVPMFSMPEQPVRDLDTSSGSGNQ
jgi:E3 ubiquitin-protein ligase RAD18